MRKEYSGLDLLRGLAAFAVVLFHLSSRQSVLPLFKSGWLAVDIFFVMSGFVIAHAYDERIDKLGALQFMRLRLIRFYPLYLVGLLIGVVRQLLLLASGSLELSLADTAIAFACSLLFLPSPVPGSMLTVTPIDWPAWSLVFEVWINAAYATLHRHLNTLNLGLIAFAAATFLVAWSLMGLDVSGASIAGVARILYSFPVGVLLYRFRDRIRVSSMTGLFAIICAMVLMNFDLPTTDWSGLPSIVVASPLIVAAASCAEVPKRLSNYCGTTSYFVYIIHSPLIFIASGIAHKVHAPEMAVVAPVVVALFAVAPLADRFYDRPMRSLLSRLSRERFLVFAGLQNGQRRSSMQRSQPDML